MGLTAVPTPRPLLIAEMFGPTFQGEGPSCGRRAVFVRLSRCNLTCPACDTPYTWDWARFDVTAETHRMAPRDVVRWVLAQPGELVVITGGEPLLQQDLLAPVVAHLVAAGRRVEIETNGTIAPSSALVSGVAAFNVSPKLARFSGLASPEQRIRPAALRAFQATGRAVFKFVVSHLDELDEIAELESQCGLAPIWVMPEGTSTALVLEGLRSLADPVLARGWHLSTRLHVLIWGDERGK